MAAESPENILVKEYLYPRKTHNYDRDIIPYGVRGPDDDTAQVRQLTVALVEQYEKTDGSGSQLNVGTPSNPVYYDDPLDLFENYDARLRGTVIVPFDLWRGEPIDGAWLVFMTRR